MYNLGDKVMVTGYGLPVYGTVERIYVICMGVYAYDIKDGWTQRLVYAGDRLVTKVL